MKKLIPLACIVFFSLCTKSYANDSLKTVAFLGDSLTAGYQIGQDLAFPALLETRLNTPSPQVEVINAGVSGDTSAGGLRRVDWILQRKIDVLVVALGANDMLRGQKASATQNNINAIVSKAQKKYPNIKIIIAGMKGLPSMGKEYALNFERIFSEVADSSNSIFVPFLLEGVAGQRDYNLPDRIHPNAKGHMRIAETLLPFLESALKE
jgi:acyl-CoA thioesterase-1